jgi:hypothetical protein
MNLTPAMIEAAARVLAHRDVFNVERWREYAEKAENALVAALSVGGEHVVVMPEILDAVADDAATINGWTDRHPATIVRRTATTLTVQRDRTSQMSKPENVESGLAFASGKGDVVVFMRDADAPLETYTLRSNGRYVRKGEPKSSRASLTIGRRDTYRDPSF